MAAKNQQLGPFEYLFNTTVLFLSLLIPVTVMSIPVLGLAAFVEPLALGFALASLMGFTYLLAQHAMFELQGDSTDSDASGSSKWVVFLAGGVLYNLIVGAGLAIALLTNSYLGPSAGLLVALVYPLWDYVTTERAIPLSVGGFLTLVIKGLLMLDAMGSSTASVLTNVGGAPVHFLNWSGFGRKKRLN